MLFRRNKPVITRQDALRAKPRRLVEVQMQLSDDGGGKLKVPLASPRFGGWLFRMPAGAAKTFEFDAIGLFVWNHCDGKTTVQQIIRKLAKEYQLNLREAEVPTVQFLSTLARRGLIGMRVNNRKQ